MIVGDFPQGGMDFPAAMEAGDTPIYVKRGIKEQADDIWTASGAGWGFTAQATGVYRVSYVAFGGGGSVSGYVKLKRNGVDVAGSEFTGGYSGSYKVIDVAMVAGDEITLWQKVGTYGGNARSVTGNFAVSILAPDVQTAINEIIMPNA